MVGIQIPTVFISAHTRRQQKLSKQPSLPDVNVPGEKAESNRIRQLEQRLRSSRRVFFFRNRATKRKV